MSNEAISMCKHLTTATVRGDVNGQYHWANLIMLDALANGARGPEAEDAIDELKQPVVSEPYQYPLGHDEEAFFEEDAEDAIEEARR